jgi:hypothetical protein
MDITQAIKIIIYQSLVLGHRNAAISCPARLTFYNTSHRLNTYRRPATPHTCLPQ